MPPRIVIIDRFANTSQLTMDATRTPTQPAPIIAWRTRFVGDSKGTVGLQLIRRQSIKDEKEQREGDVKEHCIPERTGQVRMTKALSLSKQAGGDSGR